MCSAESLMLAGTSLYSDMTKYIYKCIYLSIHGTRIGMSHYEFNCSAMSFQVLRLCIQGQRQNLCVIV